MKSSEKKLIAAAAVAGVAIGLVGTKIMEIREKKEAERLARLTASEAAFQYYKEKLNYIIGAFDEQIEQAKFWNIVSQDM